MRFCTYICTLFIALLAVAGCDRTPEQVYTPPVLSGKAYVLADDADHIAIVDLATTALSRIKMDKKGLDLAIANKELYVLAEDGTLASLKDQNTLSPWQKGVPGGLAMTAAPDKGLWILGKKELVHLIPGQGPIKSLAIDGDYSALFFGEKADTLWLVNRAKSTITPFNLTTAKAGATISHVGNSVHKGLAFPGANELWLAEGNEYLNGEPYGVGYATKGMAMPGGINVIDLKTGRQNDFIMVGGNVVDLAITPQRDKVYAAVCLLPDYDEATVAVVNTKSRRDTAELRLCFSCHQNKGVTLKRGQGKVRAMAIAFPEATK
jgi:DNA-binding beta-propeller fold protein YncE